MLNWIFSHFRQLMTLHALQLWLLPSTFFSFFFFFFLIFFSLSFISKWKLHWKLFCHEEIKLQKLSVSIEMQDIFIIFLYSFSAVSIYLRIFFCIPFFAVLPSLSLILHANFSFQFFFFCCWIIQFFHSTIDSFCHRIVKYFYSIFFCIFIHVFVSFCFALFWWKIVTWNDFIAFLMRDCKLIWNIFVWNWRASDIWRQFK